MFDTLPGVGLDSFSVFLKPLLRSRLTELCPNSGLQKSRQLHTASPGRLKKVALYTHIRAPFRVLFHV